MSVQPSAYSEHFPLCKLCKLCYFSPSPLLPCSLPPSPFLPPFPRIPTPAPSSYDSRLQSLGYPYNVEISPRTIIRKVMAYWLWRKWREKAWLFQSCPSSPGLPSGHTQTNSSQWWRRWTSRQRAERAAGWSHWGMCLGGLLPALADHGWRKQI